MKLTDLRALLEVPEQPKLETPPQACTPEDYCTCCKRSFLIGDTWIVAGKRFICVACHALCSVRAGEHEAVHKHSQQADTIHEVRACRICGNARGIVAAGIGGGVSIQPCKACPF